MEEEKKIILNLLLDKLFDEYKAENARKDTLESKALGFYTIIGIILADVIALQIAFKKIKIKILNNINIFILILLGIIYTIFIINNFILYKPKKRQNFSLSGENWNIYLKIGEESTSNTNPNNKLDEFIKSFKDNITGIINDNKQKNDILVKKIKAQSLLCFLSGLLLLINIIIFIIAFLYGD